MGLIDEVTKPFTGSSGDDGSDGTTPLADPRTSEEIFAENSALQAEMFGLATEYGQAMIAANLAATQDLARFNVTNFPIVSNVALRQSTGAAGVLNDFMQQEYYAALDQLYPQWRTDIVGAAGDAQASSIDLTRRFEQNVMPEVLASADRMSAQALATNEAMLRGELSPETQAAVERSSAEISMQMGVRGQSSQYMTARDLGLTSMQLQQQGLANSQASLGLASGAYSNVNQTLQMPVQTGMNVTNLLGAYRAPLADPSALYGGQLNILSGAGAVSPNTAYSTNAQTQAAAGSLAQTQVNFGAERSDSWYWNNANYQAQQEANSIARNTDAGGDGGLLSDLGSMF